MMLESRAPNAMSMARAYCSSVVIRFETMPSMPRSSPRCHASTTARVPGTCPSSEFSSSSIVCSRDCAAATSLEYSRCAVMRVREIALRLRRSRARQSSTRPRASSSCVSKRPSCCSRSPNLCAAAPHAISMCSASHARRAGFLFQALGFRTRVLALHAPFGLFGAPSPSPPLPLRAAA